LDDFVADGVEDEIGEGVEAELEHDVGAMSFGGVDADVEKSGDLLVGFTLGEELEDFAFAGRDAGTGRFGRIGRVGNFGDFRYAGGEVGLVLAKGLDGGDEDAIGFVLEDVAASAGVDNLVNEFVGFVHGEDEDFGSWKGLVNATSGLDAIEERHADIKDEDIGLQLDGFVDGLAAVGGFGANLPTSVRFEECTEPGADDGVIIRDKKAQRCHEVRP
jgi:hypothetical protein